MNKRKTVFNARPASVANHSKVKICGMASTEELLAKGIIKQSDIKRYPEGAAAGLSPTRTLGEEFEHQFRFAPNYKGTTS